MKTRLFIATAMLMMSTASFAQFTNSGSSNIGDYNTIYLQWNPSSIVPKEGSSYSFTGFSAGYNHAFSLSQSIPLYVETGVGIQYSFWSGDTPFPYKRNNDRLNNYEGKITDAKIKMLSAKVPLSFAYKFDIPNSDFSIIPNAGIDFRFNILAKLNHDKFKNAVDLFDEDMSNVTEDSKGYKLGETWKRFQVGWHVGVNFMYKNTIMIGGSYGTDFSTIWNYFDCKMRTGSVTLGYCF